MYESMQEDITYNFELFRYRKDIDLQEVSLVSH
jgi:hypothetical protein